MLDMHIWSSIWMSFACQFHRSFLFWFLTSSKGSRPKASQTIPSGLITTPKGLISLTLSVAGRGPGRVGPARNKRCEPRPTFAAEVRWNRSLRLWSIYIYIQSPKSEHPILCGSFQCPMDTAGAQGRAPSPVASRT